MEFVLVGLCSTVVIINNHADLFYYHAPEEQVYVVINPRASSFQVEGIDVGKDQNQVRRISTNFKIWNRDTLEGHNK